MQYTATAFYNTRREALDKGFEPGDMIARVGEPFAVEADTIREVASKTFRAYNIEGRQGGERSMSVGDVIHVESASGGGVWLTVEVAGFGMLDTRPTVSGPIGV